MRKVIVLWLCIAAYSLTGRDLLPMHTGEVFIADGDFRQWTIKTIAGKAATNSYHALVMSSNKDGTAAKCQAELNMNNQNSEGFDRFILVLNNAGKETSVQLFVETDRGVKRSKRRLLKSKYYFFIDLTADISGATAIKKITLEFEQKNKGRGRSGISPFAMILRNTAEFTAYTRHWRRFSKLKWDNMLKPETYNPEYKLLYGLLCNQKDLESYRKKYKKYFTGYYKNWQEKNPAVESLIEANIATASGTREYIVKKYAKVFPVPVFNMFCDSAKNFAFAGLVAKNKKQMRYAARMALTLATMSSWCDAPFKDLSGGIGPAFQPSSSAYTLSVLLDMAGEMLTVQGRNYILRALMFKGIAAIQYAAWTNPYIFKMNQGMAFLRGELAALLVFNKNYQRVMPVLQAAKAGIDESVNHCFAADGSYLESTSYMYMVATHMAQVYGMYANMMNRPLAKVLPPNVQKSGDFAEVIASTSKNPEIFVHSIGACHSWKYMDMSSAAFMAAAVPNSMWVNLYKKLPSKTLTWQKFYPDHGMLIYRYCTAADKGRSVEPKNFVLLKSAGIASSLRRSGEELTKLVVLGDGSPGMGKKHSDVGSFILEYAGDIYAMDMPLRYGMFGMSQYHNMLVPVNKKGEFVNSISYAKCRKREEMCPVASGDAKKFDARMDVSNSWDKRYFKKHLRSINSENPTEITISDKYKLGRKATAVAFLWNTYLPCSANGNKITISGNYGSKCEIIAPDDCKVELDKFSPGASVLKGMFLPVTHKCTRIIIRKKCRKGEEGKLCVKVKLIPPVKK